MTGSSDTEDDALDFDFLNNAGSVMFQWSEQVRKLTNCKNVTKTKVSEFDKKHWLTVCLKVIRLPKLAMRSMKQLNFV